MDYCHQCQRHLNGALACAGCGTPVEELRRYDTREPAADHVLELDVVSEPAGHRRARRQAPPRRKSAGTRRARKPRGRKVLLGTFGLVLAAGALSLAELAMESGGDDGAATSVKEKDTAVETEIPEPSGPDETPQGPERVKEPVVSSSASVPPTGTGTGTVTGTGPADGKGTGTGTGSGTGTGTGGDGEPATSEPSDDPPPPSPSAPVPEPPDSEAPSASDDPPGVAPTASRAPAQPAPAPSPTETCTPVFWFCW